MENHNLFVLVLSQEIQPENCKDFKWRIDLLSECSIGKWYLTYLE